jgi:hypothetical protein
LKTEDMAYTDSVSNIKVIEVRHYELLGFHVLDHGIFESCSI